MSPAVCPDTKLKRHVADQGAARAPNPEQVPDGGNLGFGAFSVSASGALAYRDRSGEPHFRELEPDLGLAAPTRGTSQCRLTRKPATPISSRGRGTCEASRVPPATVPLRESWGSAPDLQQWANTPRMVRMEPHSHFDKTPSRARGTVGPTANRRSPSKTGTRCRSCARVLLR